MDYHTDRTWMYTRINNRGGTLKANLDGIDEFIRTVTRGKENDPIHCPCLRCNNLKILKGDDVKMHLYERGFAPNYFVWKYHGEVIPPVTLHRTPYGNVASDHSLGTGNFTDSYIPENRMEEMIYDGARHLQETIGSVMEETPNEEAKKFFDMLKSPNRPLWEGCTTHTELSATARFISIKSKHNNSENCLDDYLQACKEMLPPDNFLAESFTKIKKLVSSFGLPYEQIDTCRNGCMLYWKDDKELTHCKICSATRYLPRRNTGKNVPFTKLHYLPLIPRLKRLYASKATAAHMRWHALQNPEDGFLSHPSDGEAWKHFDRTYPGFAKETRSVRLGLCTDGFAPFKHFGKNYSCWPVILTPYNLPPWMCMKNPYMYLTLIIPGPRDPKQGIDVYLQPLIEELIFLWNTGVVTYDVSTKTNFKMFASLLWTINDFPAYGMLSGWSTAGRLSCPLCMEMTTSFYLKNGSKHTWFDCHRCFLSRNHTFRKDRKRFRKNIQVYVGAPPMLSSVEIFERIQDFPKIYDNEMGLHFLIPDKGTTHNWLKRSIFWELPYWKDLLLRHNVDVMHNEKNVFENIFNTVLNVKGKTKDDLNSRRDIKLYCNRPELEVLENNENKKPKALYELNRSCCKLLLQWVEKLKLPDGICSNLHRCVDLSRMKMSGMKSHDCHIFLENLLPIALKELLPQVIWQPITELCLFYKELCSTKLKVERIQHLESNIPELLCKLERIFPPGFFNCMEHLPIHLPREAMLRGPVQYGWMYPFERYLFHLKKKVSNKGRVEASICNAYILEEAAIFFSHYFEDHVKTIHNQVPRNDEGVGNDSDDSYLSVFKKQGQPSGKSKSEYMTDSEYIAARNYIVLNCIELEPYFRIFREQFPSTELTSHFADWFRKYVHDSENNVWDQRIKLLSLGPQRKVKKYQKFFANGYKFMSDECSANKSTYNSGVCVKGTDDPEEHMTDFYGILKEIYEVTYSLEPPQKTYLFKCHWFDDKENIGISKVHPSYNLIEVKHTSKYGCYDPFILAKQAIQVYYVSYPSENRNKKDWWAVVKTKARNTFDTSIPNDEAYQVDFESTNEFNLAEYDDLGPLNDENVQVEAFNGVDDEVVNEEYEVENEEDDDEAENVEDEDEE